MSRVLLLAAVAVILSATPVAAQESEVRAYTKSDTFWALDEVAVELGVSWLRLYYIVRCETGGTFNPYSVGRQRELGVAQLHPRGELRTFYAWGYNDPYSPYQAIRFLAQRLLQGGARYWSCA